MHSTFSVCPYLKILFGSFLFNVKIDEYMTVSCRNCLVQLPPMKNDLYEVFDWFPLIHWEKYILRKENAILEVFISWLLGLLLSLCQVLLPLLKSDLYEVLKNTLEGKLSSSPPLWQEGMAAVTVVMASPGYPGAYKKGIELTGQDTALHTLLHDIVSSEGS